MQIAFREFKRIYFFLYQGKIFNHSTAMVENFNAEKGEKKEGKHTKNKIIFTDK